MKRTFSEHGGAGSINRLSSVRKECKQAFQPEYKLILAKCDKFLFHAR